MKLQAGYQGEDNMRKKAKMMADKHLSGMTEPPQSFSSKSREKTRMYKSGGQPKMHHDIPMEKNPPKLAKTPKLNIEKMSNVENKGYKRGGKNKFADGGMVGTGFRDTSMDGRNQGMNNQGGFFPPNGLAQQAASSMRMSGHQMPQVPQMAQAQQAPMPGQGGFSTMPVNRPTATMRNGGHAYAKGGSVALAKRELVGEKPGRKSRHSHPESDMVGMHGRMKVGKTMEKRGHRDDASKGQIKKTGYRGSDTASKMKCGGSAGFAMGGAGKMRKGEMTSSGKAVMKRDDESHHQNRARGGHTFAASKSNLESQMRGEHGHMEGTKGMVSKSGRNDSSRGQILRKGAGQRSDMKTGGTVK
jgi:hypothetical protein